jgi:hypothetical protein
MTDTEDMAMYDQLPKWAREVLQESDSKFSAAELLPMVRAGGITPFNIKVIIAASENAARQRARRAARNAGVLH